MTRRKKQPPQYKHHQVMDSSGWTHVVRGPKGGMAPIRQVTNEPATTTVGAFTTFFQTMCRPHWQGSSCLQSLAQVLKQRILSREDLTVNNVVCLGLGSLSEGGLTPCYEFAALLSIIELLRRYPAPRSISCKSTKHTISTTIFQDPIFTAVDKAYLATHGFSVVDDPQAFSEINNQTIVFAPHLEVAQTATALENAKPAVFIGNNLDGYVDGLYSQHAEQKKPGSCAIFQQYMDWTSCMAMPEFDRTSWTHETYIYWHRDPRERRVLS